MKSAQRKTAPRRPQNSHQSQQSNATADLDVAKTVVARPSDAIADTDSTLGVLLVNNEDLLLKVLSHIVQDGLHECRCVCHRWREACGKLPVRLHATRLDMLNVVTDLFPQAVSLNLNHWLDSTHVVRSQVIPYLCRLKKLQDLKLLLSKKYLNTRGLMAQLTSMEHLRSLYVCIGHNREVKVVVRALRCLTNLESLCLRVNCGIQRDLEPIAEVRGLRDLTIDLQIVVNSRGELLFPALTRLTYLCVSGSYTQRSPRPVVDLQVCEFRKASDLSECLSRQAILPYAPTLQSLDIGAWNALRRESAEGPPWQAFWHLSSLSMRTIFRREIGIFQALWKMHQLTKLDVAIKDQEDQQAFAASMFSLTQIRSLTLKCQMRSGIAPEITERLSILTRLAQLSLEDLQGIHSLRLPTGVADLKLKINANRDLPVDVLDVLLPMTNLTSLDINSAAQLHLFHPQGAEPCRFAQELRDLKALTTRNVSVDDLFLDALEAMTQLTELSLSSARNVDPFLVCPRLSPLSNLRVLSISVRRSFAGCFEFPQLCLPKLRELDLPLSDIDANAYRALLKTLPCLRKVSLFGTPKYYE